MFGSDLLLVIEIILPFRHIFIHAKNHMNMVRHDYAIGNVNSGIVLL